MGTEAGLLSTMDVSSFLDQQRQENSAAAGIGDLQDDPFLQELMTSQQGIDLFASVFDGPGSHASLQFQGPGPAMEASLDLESLLMLPSTGVVGAQPTSPVNSEGCTSESSSVTNCNRLDSPVGSLTSVGGGGSGCEQRGVAPSSSPTTQSPLMSAAFSDAMIGQWSPSEVAGSSQETETRGSGSDYSPRWSASPPSYPMEASSHGSATTLSGAQNSSDVRIDVDLLRESASPSSSSSSDRKAATLVLTEEEKRLLTEEGIVLPTDMPLTKAEQKNLKRIQRKIKNKVSAQESRRRKKEYVEGLEDRVKLSTQKNQQLSKEVDKLRTENRSLAKQLKDLQELVASFIPTKVQAGTAGTMLMVLVLSFSLFVLPPSTDVPNSYTVATGYARQTRTLLFTETDEFGNVIDPNTRQIISVAGGHTPLPLPFWLDQTPAILRWMNKTRLTVLRKIGYSGQAEKLHEFRKERL